MNKNPETYKRVLVVVAGPQGIDTITNLYDCNMDHLTLRCRYNSHRDMRIYMKLMKPEMVPLYEKLANQILDIPDMLAFKLVQGWETHRC